MTGHKATGDHLLAGYASDFRHGIKISAVNKTTDREGNICFHVAMFFNLAGWGASFRTTDRRSLRRMGGIMYYDLPSFFRASFVTQTIMTACLPIVK